MSFRTPKWFTLLALLLGAFATAGARAQDPGLPAGLQDAFLGATGAPFTASGGTHTATHKGVDFALANTGLQAQAPGIQWSITTRGAGRADAMRDLSATDAVPTGKQVEYRHDGITEWYRNTPFGVEQGFTITASPPGGGKLTVRLEANSDLDGKPDKNGRGLSFAGANGRTLRYDHLAAFDATGRELDASFHISPGQIRIEVDDRGAVYPVTIDPMIYVEEKTLVLDGVEGHAFGAAVALSADGNTALMGAPGEGGKRGAAYLFVKAGSLWAMAARLAASDGITNDALGLSVALDAAGDVALVGAPRDDSAIFGNRGAAYVFVKPADGWVSATETAKLNSSDGAPGHRLGYSVALDAAGNTALAGSIYHRVGTNNAQGAAYVFVKPAGGWATATETAELTASDGAANDVLGWSVALDAAGDIALVGAPAHDVTAGIDTNEGAAYVFVRPAGGWVTGTQTAQLTAPDGAAQDVLGASVVLNAAGTVALAGAPRNPNVTPVTGAGAAYVFREPDAGWATPASSTKLTPSDGADRDFFGASVALDAIGYTALVGAPGHDVGAGVDQGAAYVLFSSDRWFDAQTQTAQLTASDGVANALYGRVAVAGDTVLVGAPGALGDPGNGIQHTGAAYFYQPHTDLAVSAAFSPARAKPGDIVVLTATVANYGPTYAPLNTALNVPVPSPTNLTSNGTPTVTQGNYPDDRSGPWVIGPFPPGTTAKFIWDLKVSPGPARTVPFTVSTVGSDTNIANNSATAKLRVLGTAAFNSIGTEDGWVLESSETSNLGGTLNSTATTFLLGDNATKKQYRSILSFNTSTLPDTAVITKVSLKIKKASVSGTDPFTILGPLNVDIRKPQFGAVAGLEIGDFSATAGMSNIGAIPNTPVANWYEKVWTTNTFFSQINLTGKTQFRLRFATDDNNNAVADFMAFFSGNAATASDRPTLTVEYYLP